MEQLSAFPPENPQNKGRIIQPFQLHQLGVPCEINLRSKYSKKLRSLIRPHFSVYLIKLSVHVKNRSVNKRSQTKSRIALWFTRDLFHHFNTRWIAYVTGDRALVSGASLSTISTTSLGLYTCLGSDFNFVGNGHLETDFTRPRAIDDTDRNRTHSLWMPDCLERRLVSIVFFSCQT